MSGITRVLGWLWALPLTLVGLLYVSLFSLLGWYKKAPHAWVLQVHKAPKWLHRRLHLHSGHVVGTVIVLDADLDTHHGRAALRHHQEHVRQAKVMGVLFPLIWLMGWLPLACCDHAHPFWDHPLEIDARRAAGQAIDVIGALKKAVAEGKIKPPSHT